jgi:hypothetical protein
VLGRCCARIDGQPHTHCGGGVRRNTGGMHTAELKQYKKINKKKRTTTRPSYGGQLYNSREHKTFWNICTVRPKVYKKPCPESWNKFAMKRNTRNYKELQLQCITTRACQLGSPSFFICCNGDERLIPYILYCS